MHSLASKLTSGARPPRPRRATFACVRDILQSRPYTPSKTPNPYPEPGRTETTHYPNPRPKLDSCKAASEIWLEEFCSGYMQGRNMRGWTCVLEWMGARSRDFLEGFFRDETGVKIFEVLSLAMGEPLICDEMSCFSR
ncbi:hypothetical protein VTL71DRAFT_5745, partial [Oculimacula yallundae]